MSLPALGGERVTLRPLADEDFPRVLEILAHPEVRPWWGRYDAVRLEKDFLSEDGDAAFVIVEGDHVVGMVSYWEELDPEYRHAGMDIAMDGERLGEGIGTDALRTLARWLIEERRHHRLTIDPAADNARAIRAYEKLGFRPVGVLRRYWRDADGTWRDGLLMDLLAGELCG